MNYYYITGTSRGIGKAITDRLLSENNNKVIGISRSNSISHNNYKHVTLDLTDVKAVSAFRFGKHDDAKRIVLINNAGTILEIKRTGKLKDDTISVSYNVNLISPCLLTNRFINTYNGSKARKIILNVSSGAGRHPVDAWSCYCGAKAGLDLFSKTVALEQSITEDGFKIFSVGPGVVDTEMQEEIRKLDKNEFSRLDEFIGYKENGQLADPKWIAEKYIEIIEHSNEIDEVVFSINEYEKMKKGNK